ncbi:MAG: SPOR domain-containing protein [Sulfurovaceae bacterium]|nr:SPOR domain-containing protein [Sulfurovaceae bacterium]
MKKQDSLDDLIIGENLHLNKNNNSKNILTMIGLVLAVLIGAIFLTKTVLEEPQKPKIPLEENLTNSALVQADMNESNLSDVNESIMMESNTSVANEEVNTSIKEVSPTPNDTKVETVVVAPKKVTEKTINKDSIKKLLPVKKKVDEQQLATKDSNKTDAKTTATTTQTKTNTETKPVAKNTNTNNETYYAQVGAFSNKPSDGFIEIIKKNGYSYKIVNGQNGSSKILIGPYSGREKADLALQRIKDRINKSAFLVKQ